MIARLLAILSLAFLLAAATPDWTKAVRPTPAGGRLVGNPAAPVKLVEFASYTCPHCAHFAGEASAPLAQAIRTGRLSVELRPIAFDQIGLAATVVARCVPANRFWAVNEALYARQGQWFQRAYAYANTNSAELTRYPVLDQLRELSVNGGIGAVAGLTDTQTAACFADPAKLADVARATDAASVIVTSTPAFMVGAQKYEGLTWATLLPKLRAAGLK